MTRNKQQKKQLSKNDGYPWFPFDVVDWLTSADVRKMTCSERGVYITLLAVQWRDGKLPRDLAILSKCTALVERTLANFLTKFPHLFATCGTDVEHMTNPKLQKLALTVGKLKDPTPLYKIRGEGEEDDICFPRKRGNKNNSSSSDQSSVQSLERWPGDPDPDCSQCHGRGNWIADGVTIACPCTVEA